MQTNASAPAVLTGTSGLGDYPSEERREHQARGWAETLGGELVHYGESVQGRPLTAVRVPATGNTSSRVLCAANIHGVELIAGRVALGLLDGLHRGEGLLGELREKAEVWVIPCANPDGYARTVAQGGVGTLAQLRTNAHGVDLNRNFPLPHGAKPSRKPFTGSHRHGDATYRGPAPLSEPEVRHLDALFAAQRFHAVLSLHSFMGTLIPARVLEREEYNAYGQLCRAFVGRQQRWGYRRMGSMVFDAFTGELEDHVHHTYRAWACCVESFPVPHSIRQHLRAPSLFWRFNPREALTYVANDVPGLAAFFLHALSLPRPGGER
ncbi:MAG: M14 family metallopeptidase [Myxococcota bacterium]